MPDIDVFFGWAPWAPLAMHRGFTHGLVGGVLVMPPLLAGLLWLLDRWQVGRGRIPESAMPMRIGWLVALSYLGAITHPLLDLQNVYAVQLMSPASERWFHTDGLFIVSPWLLAMLGLGIWLARRKGKGWPAGAGLAVGISFILLNLGISTLAYRALRLSEPYPVPDRIFASPEPLAFWRRDMIWREQGQITFGRYDPLRGAGRVTDRSAPVRDDMDTAWAKSAASKTPEAAKFLAWSQMPMARIERRGPCNTVTFGDARFTGPRLARNFNVAVTDCVASD